MMIVITGTPGTGKTSVGKRLAVRGKMKYISLNDLVFERKAYKEYDESRGSYVVDLEKLEKICEELKKKSREEDIVVEGHLAHYCRGDIIIVLRASPVKLKQRMRKKKYDLEKIKENVEAEIVDVILQEVMDLEDQEYYDESSRIYEIDTSDKDVDGVVTIILRMLRDEEYAKNFLPGRVDWTDHILEGKIDY